MMQKFSALVLLAVGIFCFLPFEAEAACSKPDWPIGTCGCDWKNEDKPTNYQYQTSATDLSSTGWECAKDAWGVLPGEFCCAKGNWIAPCGLGWEEPYGPIKNDYQKVKTATANGLTGWTCVANQYGAAADESCCKKPKTGTSGTSGAKGAAIPQTGSTAGWQLQNPEGTGIQLVSCTQTGDCKIDDLVQQGINFSKWLMGLAGALFLVVFVYGGAMYLAAFGRSAWVTKGQNALVRGAIGIVLVMGAWTIVSYVATSLGYTPVGTGATTGGGTSGGAAGSGTSGGAAGGTTATTGCICSGSISSNATADALLASGKLFGLIKQSDLDTIKQICNANCKTCNADGTSGQNCSISINKDKATCSQTTKDSLADSLGVAKYSSFVNTSFTCTFK